MGADSVVEPYMPALLDSELEISIEALVYDSAASVETKLNLIRKEVNLALAADHTLGLPFVQSIVELGASAPKFGADQAKPSASIELLYRVVYRRSRPDPSA